ncbi:biotin/lipoyl-containing protein [Rhodopirellula sp. SWK7]|uniref:biotin/lipoyl-containing protein n=1 Tax=Rhodopirellula sp. SWK7 TaxID=595460 RepID=UPI0002BE3AF1|nr:biotin/lipoyl-containing protein [Rhodopirellula sp. SWK7]EMI44751.1 Biotin/lipoyl attachment domain protein [Rhodopirellula sp. SWK7]
MKKLKITVEGKAYEVTVERMDEPGAASSPAPLAAPAPSQPAAPVKRADSSPRPPIKAGSITSPMAGVVLSVDVADGEEVEQEQLLLVLEAMKMENQIIAPAPAKVAKVHVKAGESVAEGQVLVELE